MVWPRVGSMRDGQGRLAPDGAGVVDCRRQFLRTSLESKPCVDVFHSAARQQTQSCERTAERVVQQQHQPRISISPRFSSIPAALRVREGGKARFLKLTHTTASAGGGGGTRPEGSSWLPTTPEGERGVTCSCKSGRARGCDWCSSGSRPPLKTSAPAPASLLSAIAHHTCPTQRQSSLLGATSRAVSLS